MSEAKPRIRQAVALFPLREFGHGARDMIWGKVERDVGHSQSKFS